MKRAFNFRLARVAKIREVFEDLARGEFTAALNELQAIENYCQSLRDEIDQGRHSLALSQQQSRIDIRGILARERSIQALAKELTKARSSARQAELLVEEKRRAWQTRNQDCRALDELEKRHRDRHLQDISHADNADADEVAIQRFSHPRS